ncbi:hypothetical protein SteCoe_28790 [Stentor coeruleus]|uniref:Uncharacterized protein n=1 Tax=Stentor coeruleus TaxID=5963 RepID=A0A1R2B7F4_9CILI|nr:hypothetical protein SteCoe_28790 [Stentor coeruleus]
MNFVSSDLERLKANVNKPEDSEIEIEKVSSFLKYYQDNPIILSDSTSYLKKVSENADVDVCNNTSFLENELEKLNISTSKTEDSQTSPKNSKSKIENNLHFFEKFIEFMKSWENKLEKLENLQVDIEKDIRSLKETKEMMEIRYLITSLGTCLENILDQKLYVEHIDQNAINRTPIKRNVPIFTALIKLILNLKDHNIIATLKFSNCQRYIWGIEIEDDFARKLIVEVLASKGLRPKESGFLVIMFNEENYKRVLKKKATEERQKKREARKIGKYYRE